jgi:hypothetical protein
MRYLSYFIILLLITSLFICGCNKDGEEKESEEETVGSLKKSIGGINVNDEIFAQWMEGEGKAWEKATVNGIKGEEVTIEWVDSFNKDAPEAVKNYKNLIKVKPLDTKTSAPGDIILVQPPDKQKWAYYKGEIIEKKDDSFSIEYVDKDQTVQVEVKPDRLWNFE